MSKLKWLGAQGDIDRLVARGKLERAIELLEEQLREAPESVGCRQQLGDILGRAGHKQRAIAVLAPLIDAFATDGFTAKAIAVIKKLERLDPKRVDTGHLIAKVRRQAEPSEPVPLVPAHLESETITLEPLPDDGGDRPEATSMIDADWFEQVESRRPTFGWSPLLDDLPPATFDAVAGSLILLVKNPGSIIFGQGERATSVFVLANGFARAYRRSASERYRQALVFEEGQFFGEEALFEPDARRPITVTAAAECELLEIDPGALARIVAANPEARDELEAVYEQRPWVLE